MANEKEKVDSYLNTISRFEPDIAPTDSSAYGTSIAISLKRIADALDGIDLHLKRQCNLLEAIEMSIRSKGQDQ